MSGQHDDGSLEAGLAQAAHHFASIGIGQADVHDHEIRRTGFRRLRALGPGIDGAGLEFLMQRKLLDQRVTKIAIIVHDQNFARVSHCNSSRRIFP